MPIGLVSPQPLSVGLAPISPVTPVQPVITPDAVNSLVNSFHNGVITGDDLAAHSGMMQYLRNRSEGQRLREDVSPEAIGARQAALGASTAQSNLQMQSAQAAQGLVQPQTGLAEATIAKEHNDLLDKQAVESFKAWNPTIYKDDGVTPDYQSMAEAGRPYIRAQAMLQYATQGLAGTPSQEKNPKTGQPVTVLRNALGEDVTPFAGNKAYEHYADLRREAQELMFSPAKVPKKGGPIEDAAPSGPITTPGAAPTPSPDSESLVSPAVAAPAPAVVEPYMPGTGRPTGAVPGTTPPEIRDELRKEPQYEYWSQKLGSMRDFTTAAKRIYEPAPEDTHLGVQTMNERDFALMNALRQLATPVTSASAGGGRGTPDLQGAKIEENLPILERLSDWKQVVARTGALTEGTRRRLIQLGNDYIQSKEATVKPILQGAIERAGGVSPEDLWGSTSDQANLLKGRSLAYVPPEGAQVGGANPASPVTPVKGVVIFKTGPYKGRAMRPNGDGTFSPVQ